MLTLRVLGVFALGLCQGWAAGLAPAAQRFEQEVSCRFGPEANAPSGPVQLIDCQGTSVRAFASGRWHELRDGRWRIDETLATREDGKFTFANGSGQPVEVNLPWREVRQILRAGPGQYAVSSRLILVAHEGGGVSSVRLPDGVKANQAAVSPAGTLHLASSIGLWRYESDKWQRQEVRDRLGRIWAAAEVLGVAFDAQGHLWIATQAGAASLTPEGWRFYEGKDGLPWNDFTGIAAAPNGDVWFTTRLGVIRFDGKVWHYRQGPRWLPHDEVTGAAFDTAGTAWLATAAGVGGLQRRSMSLAEKADVYEQEIEKYIKRTPFGYVAEAPLRTPADKSSASPQDSDNDGLWTAMYGAGECFAYAATQDAKAKQRAKQAFEALRFLQTVTQGGQPAPPKGYIARTIRPTDWPDPNAGRLAADREQQQHDKLWKAYRAALAQKR